MTLIFERWLAFNQMQVDFREPNSNFKILNWYNSIQLNVIIFVPIDIVKESPSATSEATIEPFLMDVKERGGGRGEKVLPSPRHQILERGILYSESIRNCIVMYLSGLEEIGSQASSWSVSRVISKRSSFRRRREWREVFMLKRLFGVEQLLVCDENL